MQHLLLLYVNDVACSVPNPKLVDSGILVIRCMVDGVAGKCDALAVWIHDIVNTVAALTMLLAFLDLIMIIASGRRSVMMGWKRGGRI